MCVGGWGTVSTGLGWVRAGALACIAGPVEPGKGPPLQGDNLGKGNGGARSMRGSQACPLGSSGELQTTAASPEGYHRHFCLARNKC